MGEQLARDALADGVGFVVIDAAGTIRVQRVDIQFGQHAPQILDMLRRLKLTHLSGNAVFQAKQSFLVANTLPHYDSTMERFGDG